MSVDLRTRSDADVPQVEPAEFLATDLPAAFEAQADVLEVAAAALDIDALAIETTVGEWTLVRCEPGFAVRAGDAGDCPLVRLTDLQLADLVTDQTTPIAFMTSGTLDMPRGHIGDLLDWWLVLRSALDGRPVHVPGAVDLRGVDLERSFTLDDSDAEMREFLECAGYIHIEGVFTEAEMDQVALDMDAAAPTYAPGDGESWWAKTAAGENRLVRMQGFDRHSALTAELLADDRFRRLGGVPGAGHVHTGLEGNRIEALTKPIGVVEGISDVPWHKDCSLGRHSYECCSLTTGISVTGAGEGTGLLHAIAGSHRALMLPSLLDVTKLGLPDVSLPTRTGDVTVHLSCTLHMAQPPVDRERRVMYTSFKLPFEDAGAAAAGRARLRAARESAPVIVDQPSGVVS